MYYFLLFRNDYIINAIKAKSSKNDNNKNGIIKIIIVIFKNGYNKINI